MKPWQRDGRPYLGAAVDGLPPVHAEGAQGEVTVQLHCVELSQFDGVGVADGGHAGAHIEPGGVPIY